LQAGTVENLKGSPEGAAQFVGEEEEKCPKHRTQPVVLHCSACKANICIQWKLTSHEGHPTEDLADTGRKAQDRLGEMIRMMNEEVRRLEGVKEAIRLKEAQLQEFQETTERDIRQRVDDLCLKTKECGDATLNTLQSLNAEPIAFLTDTQKHVQQQQASLTSRSEHVARVLQDDKASDIIDLGDQLKDFSLDRQEVERLLSQVESLSKPYVCDFNATSINLAHEYIGMLKKTSTKSVKHQAHKPQFSSAPGLHSTASGTQFDPSLPMSVSGAAAAVSSSKRFHLLSFSQNPKSEVNTMCVTTQKRACIVFQPSGQGVYFGLLGQNGLSEKTAMDMVTSSIRMISCSDGTTLCFKRTSKLEVFTIQADKCDATALKNAWVEDADTIPKRINGLAKGILQNDFFVSVDLSSSPNVLVKVALNAINPIRLSVTKLWREFTTCMTYHVQRNTLLYIYRTIALQYLKSLEVLQPRDFSCHIVPQDTS
jgi:hypothetical protein